jgi:hypothetical protein
MAHRTSKVQTLAQYAADTLVQQLKAFEGNEMPAVRADGKGFEPKLR